MQLPSNKARVCYTPSFRFAIRDRSFSMNSSVSKGRCRDQRQWMLVGTACPFQLSSDTPLRGPHVGAYAQVWSLCVGRCCTAHAVVATRPCMLAGNTACRLLSTAPCMKTEIQERRGWPKWLLHTIPPRRSVTCTRGRSCVGRRAQQSAAGTQLEGPEHEGL